MIGLLAQFNGSSPRLGIRTPRQVQTAFLLARIFHSIFQAKAGTAASPDETAQGLPEPQRTLAIISVLSAMALVVLDAAMVNVALPTIARSMDVSPAASVRIITAYQAALMMGLLPCAALG